MELQQLVVLVNTYNIHFEQYWNEKKEKGTQIIPYAMWKKVYAIYILACPNNTLQEETLKWTPSWFLEGSEDWRV